MGRAAVIAFARKAPDIAIGSPRAEQSDGRNTPHGRLGQPGEHTAADITLVPDGSSHSTGL